MRGAELHGALEARPAVTQRIAYRGPVHDEDPRSRVRPLAILEAPPSRNGLDLRAEACGGSRAIRAFPESVARGTPDRGLEAWLVEVEPATADALRAEAAPLERRAKDAAKLGRSARNALDSAWGLFLEEAVTLPFAGHPTKTEALVGDSEDSIERVEGRMREALLDLRLGQPPRGRNPSAPALPPHY